MRAIPLILLSAIWITLNGQNIDPPCDALPTNCQFVTRTRCQYGLGQTCGVGVLMETRICDGRSTAIERMCCTKKCTDVSECDVPVYKHLPCMFGGESAADEETCWNYGCCWDPENSLPGQTCHMKRPFLLTCAEVYPECERPPTSTESAPTSTRLPDTTSTTTTATTTTTTTTTTTATTTAPRPALRPPLQVIDPVGGLFPVQPPINLIQPLIRPPQRLVIATDPVGPVGPPPMSLPRINRPPVLSADRLGSLTPAKTSSATRPQMLATNPIGNQNPARPTPKNRLGSLTPAETSSAKRPQMLATNPIGNQKPARPTPKNRNGVMRPAGLDTNPIHENMKKLYRFPRPPPRSISEEHTIAGPYVISGRSPSYDVGDPVGDQPNSSVTTTTVG